MRVGGSRIFRALITILICAFALGANAQPSEEDKLCIFSAAEKLPSIPGLEMTGPGQATPTGGAKAIRKSD